MDIIYVLWLLGFSQHMERQNSNGFVHDVTFSVYGRQIFEMTEQPQCIGIRVNSNRFTDIWMHVYYSNVYEPSIF